MITCHGFDITDRTAPSAGIGPPLQISSMSACRSPAELMSLRASRGRRLFVPLCRRHAEEGSVPIDPSVLQVQEVLSQ